MEEKETVLVKAHMPCEKCGSSDGLSLYSDGHTWCFVCETYTEGEVPENLNAEPVIQSKKSGGLISLSELTLRELKKRRISEATCRDADYFYANYFGKPCQVCNVLNDDGVIIQQKIRTPEKEFITLGGTIKRFIGQHRYRAGSDTLVITEGEIDMLSVLEVTGGSIPCVSLPNGASAAKKVFKAQMSWLMKFDKVVLFFDNDEPGRTAVEEVQKYIKPGCSYVAALDLKFKDANEALVSDDRQAILDAVYKPSKWQPAGVENAADSWEFMKAPAQKIQCYDFPWDLPLATKTKGLRKGEIVVLTSGTGCGKTTMAYEIMVSLAKQGLKVGFICLEESRYETYRNIISIEAHKKLEEIDDSHKEAFDKTLGTGLYYSYNTVGLKTHTSLGDAMRYLAVSCEVDFLLLDHITLVLDQIAGEDPRAGMVAQNAWINGLRDLCVETGVGLIIVSQLRKANDSSFESGKHITIDDIKGTGSLKTIANQILAVERNVMAETDDERNVMAIRILKNRFSGKTGDAGYLRYTPETHSLAPCVPPPTLMDEAPSKSKRGGKKTAAEDYGF